MANFTLSTAQLSGGGGTVTVTPASSTVFTGRKATGTLTVKNGAATSTVSLSKDYPQKDNITKVMVGSTIVTDWRDINVPATAVNNVVITSVSNRPTFEVSPDGLDITVSVKIGSIWLQKSGASSSTAVSWPATDGEYVQMTVPNNLGLTSAYTAEVTISFAANPKSYSRDIGVTISSDGVNIVQAGATATINATPASLTWSNVETAGKTVTVTSNGATIPVTVA